ncbi:MAG: hypothetical protein PHV28_02585, partial [Kiritimatiellae bacterium]|nr:hypothetical protein [Kiritimatiellia bacterium]
MGAGYGGNGRYMSDNTKIHPTYGHTYGSVHAPFMPGSQGGLYNNVYTPKAGGGSAWFKCRHKIRLDGTVVASATRYFYSGSAAGSVWLLARGFEAGSGARISAVGGGTSDAQSYTAAGGGGRISLGLGLSDVEIDALAAGETPDTLAYSDAIDLVTVDVSGGPDGTANGTKPQTYAASGTVSLVKGALADKSVAVQASPVAAGLPQPAYGVTAATVGDVLHFQATDDANGYGADPSDPTGMRWRCTGYVVSNATEEVLNGTGLGCSFDLTIPETDIFVTWIWEFPERKFSVDNPQGTGYGRLLLGGEDFVSGTPLWCGYLAEYELEAVPEEGYEFLYWSGDFPYGQAKANPLTLTIDHARSIRPVFRRYEEPTPRARTASGKFDFLDESAWSGGNFPGTNDAVVIDNACSVAGVNYIEVGSLTMSNTNARLWVGTDSEIYNRNLDTTESNTTWTTDFPTRVNDAAEEIAVIVNGAAALSDGAQLVIGAPRSQRKAHGRLEAASIALSGHSQALVTAGAIEGGFTFVSGAGFIRTTGDLAVNDHAKLRPYSDGRTGGSVKIECGGDFTVAADALVTAVGAGYAAYAETPSSQSPGYGYDYVIGGGYGGAGGCADLEHQSALTNFYGLVYGNRLAPVHPGAPNGTYNAPYMCGGGLIRVLCRGTLSVAGTLTAAPQEVAFTETYFFGGAAGGGIWLAAKNFAFASGAAMDAHGGRATYGSAGGGGRIALCKYAIESDLETFAAGSQPLSGYAYGGDRAEFETEFPGVTVNVAGGDEWSRTAPPHENLGKKGGDGTFAYIVPPQGMLILFK